MHHWISQVWFEGRVFIGVLVKAVPRPAMSVGVSVAAVLISGLAVARNGRMVLDLSGFASLIFALFLDDKAFMRRLVFIDLLVISNRRLSIIMV